MIGSRPRGQLNASRSSAVAASGHRLGHEGCCPDIAGAREVHAVGNWIATVGAPKLLEVALSLGIAILAGIIQGVSKIVNELDQMLKNAIGTIASNAISWGLNLGAQASKQKFAEMISWLNLEKWNSLAEQAARAEDRAVGGLPEALTAVADLDAQQKSVAEGAVALAAAYADAGEVLQRRVLPGHAVGRQHGQVDSRPRHRRRGEAAAAGLVSSQALQVSFAGNGPARHRIAQDEDRRGDPAGGPLEGEIEAAGKAMAATPPVPPQVGAADTEKALKAAEGGRASSADQIQQIADIPLFGETAAGDGVAPPAAGEAAGAWPAQARRARAAGARPA